MIIGLVLFGILLLMLVIGVPIAVSLGVASIISLAVFDPRVVLSVIPQRMFTSADNYVFMAVPFFMLSGELMLSGGISEKLINFVRALFCRLPASLACVTTGASAFFAALSGSNPATVAAIGGIMIPNMVKDGYPDRRAAAISAASGTLGVIIPPSIPMITFAVASNASVKSLYFGGIIPGILIAIALIFVNILTCRKYGLAQTNFSILKVWKTFKDAILALLMPVIILGGIYTGVFTPTEAAAVSAVYAFIIAKFVYKALPWTLFRKITIKAAINASIVLFVITLAASFSWYLTMSGVSAKMSSFVIEVFKTKFFILLMMNILLLFFGMLLNASSIILLLTPILLPITTQLGLDPVAVGIITVVNCSIGAITPPMAVDLFVACRISKVSLEDISFSVLPFMAAEIFVCLLITYVPDIIMFLPDIMR
ncbi:MAG: TRAP transporter large permease subunit [Spirochaetales bacterium]|jgi:C4-dicarboxylate transporter DctM subunit|nr:TRAP transporter large permease subunit [Spirochaetales bacterium]